VGLYINNLSFSYGKNRILKNISTTFNQGEITVITGPNGSGKSTLVKGIMSLIKIQKGSIYLNNKDIRRYTVEEKSRILGYVSQDIYRDFDFSVYEVVEMGRYPFKKEWNYAKDKKAIDLALNLTDTKVFRDRSINSLSGGELQRVLLARALAGEPKYLILDEPASNLDIAHNIEMMKLLKKLTRELGLTTIIVLHDLNSILHYSDNIIMLNRGKLELQGKTKKLLTPENIKNIYGISSEIVIDKSGRKHILTI